jgi:hypothetical protein
MSFQGLIPWNRVMARQGNSNVVSAESRHCVVRSVYLHNYTHAVYLRTPRVLGSHNNGAFFPRFLSTL